jgi:hypothetical protein
MPTVTSENKAAFDQEFMKKKGFVKSEKAEKNSDENYGLIKGEYYEFHHPKGSKKKYLGSTSVEGGTKRAHRFKGEGPNSYSSFQDHELEKHVKI